jgi:pyruvate/2-oxoglutarate dehydrogenase complex dihydrolipoamide dehydrogenase (E3) component
MPFDVPTAPRDAYNRDWLAAVHPEDWQNPTPAACYDLVVLGGGPAGLVVAAGAAGLGLGLRIALVEQHFLGGDCLNVGCVPSKTLLHAARTVHQARLARAFLSQPIVIEPDFAAVMQSVRRVRAQISPHDSAQRFQSLGVDVFLGQGQFLNCDTVAVGSQQLRFRKAVIATGTRPVLPPIPGLAEAAVLTNETVFNRTERPERLVILGGGPIGCELGQAFQRLGSQVTLIERGPQLLSREDADVAGAIAQRLQEEGVDLRCNTEVERVECLACGSRLHLQSEGQRTCLDCDQLLVAVGRQPNLDLNLAAAEVAADPQRGIRVDDYLRTSNPRIFAAGDVCLAWKFTHAADAAARIVIQNALFTPWGQGQARVSSLVLPWTTYTDPEVAHVGANEQDLQQANRPYEAIKVPLADLDRAQTDSATHGFFKLLHHKGQILGATIVAPQAGEMIGEITLALQTGVSLKTLAQVIHPYPTLAEGIRKLAEVYRRTQLTPNTRRLLSWLHRLS